MLGTDLLLPASPAHLSKGLWVGRVTFPFNLVIFLHPSAEHRAKWIILALGQEVRAGDLIWSKDAIH